MYRSLLICATLLTYIPCAHAQDAAAGHKVFMLCRACHQVGPNARNLIGPVLNGVVGRKAGTVPGFNYSKANKESGLTWDKATLTRYLKDPRKMVPRTKMAFVGIRDEKRIKDLIAYLKQFDASGKKAP